MKPSPYSILCCTFLYASALILFSTGAIKVATAFGYSPWLTKHDPLFQFLSNRSLFLSVGGLELCVAAYLVLGRGIGAKLGMVLWLSSSFVLYRLGLIWSGVQEPCKCLGSLMDWLPLRQSLLDSGLMFSLIFLFGGSIALVAAQRLRQRRGDLAGVPGLAGLR